MNVIMVFSFCNIHDVSWGTREGTWRWRAAVQMPLTLESRIRLVVGCSQRADEQQKQRPQSCGSAVEETSQSAKVDAKCQGGTCGCVADFQLGVRHSVCRSTNHKGVRPRAACQLRCAVLCQLCNLRSGCQICIWCGACLRSHARLSIGRVPDVPHAHGRVPLLSVIKTTGPRSPCCFFLPSGDSFERRRNQTTQVGVKWASLPVGECGSRLCGGLLIAAGAHPVSRATPTYWCRKAFHPGGCIPSASSCCGRVRCSAGHAAVP